MMPSSWLRVVWALSCVISSLSAASDILLPKPDGPYGTSITVQDLVDYSRNDTFAPTVAPRRLVISIFQPVAQGNCTSLLVDYMPNATASVESDGWSQQFRLPLSNVSLGDVRLQACAPVALPQVPYPLVIFSPALGTPRLLYSALAQHVSSQGYTVVTMDHPYETEIVTFNNASMAPVLASPVFSADDNVINDTTLALAVSVRAQDASFVLSYLINNTITTSNSSAITNATIFGHSLGGSTAAAVLLNDDRFMGGLNLDGELLGPVLDVGFDKPFMLFGVQAHIQYNFGFDKSWFQLLSKIPGWKLEINLARSRHYTFSDWPVVAEAMGLWGLNGKGWPNGVMGGVGTLAPERAKLIVRTYVTEFIKFVVGGKERDLLRGEDDDFPEVSFTGP